MITHETVMFEVGAIMLIAFIGATIAKKTNQSVILGYIVAGILIGPHMHLELGSFTYNGLFQDTSFIDSISQLGLILLMFFVGLEFSISKLRRTKAPATVMAVINLGINMFAGIMLGTALGWPIVDTIFLAGVIAMSSCAITAKSLIELRRLQNPETEFLLGMVIVETFLAMVLLTIVGGLVVKGGGGEVSLTAMSVGIIAFYAFFVLLAVFIIPRTVEYLKRIESDEVFVLFALGVVFIMAALAEASYVPGIIGAFFIGMVFAETQITERFEQKISPFRDALVAVFFVSFGMMIDPAMFGEVIWIVAIAVPLVIINDILVTASLAYFLGFTPKGAVSMGTALCGRGAESIMYASVGSRAVGVTKGAELYPFAGAFCFVMSAVTPLLMRKSGTLTAAISRRLPPFIKYSGAVISRTLSKLVMPAPLRLYHRPRRIGTALIGCFVIVVAMIATDGLLHMAIFLLGVAFLVVVRWVLRSELHPVALHTNYTSIGVGRGGRGRIANFVSSFIILSLALIMCLALVFPYTGLGSLILIILYLILVIHMMKKNYEETYMLTSPTVVSDDLLPWERTRMVRRESRWK